MGQHPIKFVSVWDMGYEIETNAMIDLETGIVDCIEEVDADDVETLDLEMIVIEDLEIEVERDDRNEYRVSGADLDAVRQRVAAIPKP